MIDKESNEMIDKLQVEKKRHGRRFSTFEFSRRLLIPELFKHQRQPDNNGEDGSCKRRYSRNAVSSSL